MREVGWVVFDEIHYMRDPERGVVWGDTLILLPDKVRFVFLSATIPNAIQFAEWITWLHKQVPIRFQILLVSTASRLVLQPCHVVYTEHRPVPLQQYLYPTNSKGLFLIVDENRQFRYCQMFVFTSWTFIITGNREGNFATAMSQLQSATTGDELSRKTRMHQNKSGQQ